MHFGKLQEIVDKPCTSLGCFRGLLFVISFCKQPFFISLLLFSMQKRFLDGST